MIEPLAVQRGCWLAVLTAVSADLLTGSVTLEPSGLVVSGLRIVHPPGLIGTLAVGDEVLVLEGPGGLARGVITGWLPTAAQAAAVTRALVVTTDAAVPLSTTPPSPIANAALAGVKAR